ncbi:MAG: 50S ribosomal protein L3 [Candidatus Anstonellales archaeon]
MTDIRKPRRGSMAFRPRKRADNENAGFNAWPVVKEKAILGFAGYKAGMLTATWLEQAEGKKGLIEYAGGATVVEAPPLYAYGVRLIKDSYCKDILTDNKDVLKLMNIKNVKATASKINEIKDKYENARLLCFSMPSLTGIGKKHIEKLELGIGGNDLNEAVDYGLSLLGKQIRAGDVLKAGMFVDVSAVTKGKGWQGPVRRFGIAKQRRKATGKIRHVGTLGQFKPPYTFYTVPHAGQTGYHKRVELNKLVMAVLPKEKAIEINPKGGFQNYGVLKNDAIIIKGSLPGPVKRLLRFRLSIRKQTLKEIKDASFTI